MKSVTPKYKLLTPQVEVEPITSLGIDREDRIQTTEEQLISRFNVGEPLIWGGISDRRFYGLNQPFDSDPSRPSGSIIVDSQPLAGNMSPILTVGSYTLIAGRDYEVGGDTSATATNIAVAISNIIGYDATPVGPQVDIEGPIDCPDLPLKVKHTTPVQVFSLDFVGPNPDELGFVTSPIFPPNLE